MAKNTCKMYDDVCLFHKGNHFTHLNITDRIARAMLKPHPQLETHFLVYPSDYKPVSDGPKIIEKKKKLGEAYKTLEKALTDLDVAMIASIVYDDDMDILKDNLAEAVGLVEAADDDKKEALQKEVDKISKEIEEIVAGREAIEKSVTEAEVKAEEAEAEVVKYNSLLRKREK